MSEKIFFFFLRFSVFILCPALARSVFSSKCTTKTSGLWIIQYPNGGIMPHNAYGRASIRIHFPMLGPHRGFVTQGTFIPSTFHLIDPSTSSVRGVRFNLSSRLVELIFKIWGWTFHCFPLQHYWDKSCSRPFKLGNLYFAYYIVRRSESNWIHDLLVSNTYSTYNTCTFVKTL